MNRVVNRNILTSDWTTKINYIKMSTFLNTDKAKVQIFNIHFTKLPFNKLMSKALFLTVAVLNKKAMLHHDN